MFCWLVVLVINVCWVVFGVNLIMVGKVVWFWLVVVIYLLVLVFKYCVVFDVNVM